MEEKTRVALIGVKAELLSKLAEKINETRPVELVYFTDLKEFLENSIDEKPEIVGVSVNFPHKNVTRFPKLFRMAFNTTVVVFGENQDPKTRKLLGSVQCDFKIQGQINPHNLWMKILNILKEKEEEAERLSNKSEEDSSEKQSNMVFLKDNSSADPNKPNKNSMLSSLFAALDDNTPKGTESNMNMIQSSDATKYKKKSFEHVGMDAQSDLENWNDGGSKSIHLTNGKKKNNLQNNNTDTKTANSINNNQGKKTSNLQNPSLSMGAKSLGELLEEDDEGYKQSVSQSGLNNSVPNPIGSGENPLASNNQQDEKKSYGKVKLADEEEVKQEDARKNKERTEQENLKKKNILIASCELGLKKNFESTPSVNAGFVDQVSKVQVYILEAGTYKGFLVLARSDNKFEENVEEFRKTIIENFKKNGMSCDLAKATEIPLSIKNYSMAVKEFSDFSINSVGENSYCNISFVVRESLRPSFQESDKEDMYNVDIKVIPPKTTVNFDAYIYLPMNKRFVRYLKAGRSLSLKQSKRFSEDVQRSKLYLPKNQKEQLISFFIQNTLDWEFTLHKKNEVA